MIFDRLAKNAIVWGTKPPGDPLISSWFAAADGNASGVHVDAESAMKTSTVFACVRLIAETIASLPLITYRHLPNGGKERAKDHPLYTMLHRRPNAKMTTFQWLERMIWDMLLRGNHFSLIVTTGKAAVSELVPLNADRMSAWQDPANNLTWFRLDKQDGTYKLFAESEILHIPMFPAQKVISKSVIEYMAESIGITVAGEQHGGRFFKNGAVPMGNINMPIGKSFKNPESRKQFLADWRAAHSGGNQHSVALLEDGTEYKPTGLTNKDSQLLELRQFQVPDICRGFRVQPHKIADLTRGTFSNIEHQSIEFKTDTISPMTAKIEQALERALFLDKWRDEFFIEFSLEGMLRGDQKSRYDAYAVGRSWGWLSANDVRRLENLNPLPDGDHYLEPLNMGVTGTNPDKANQGLLASTLITQTARRLAVREAKAVERLREKLAPPAFSAEIEKFYSAHALLISEALNVGSGSARKFADVSKVLALLEPVDVETRAAELLSFAGEYHALV